MVRICLPSLIPVPLVIIVLVGRKFAVLFKLYVGPPPAIDEVLSLEEAQ